VYDDEDREAPATVVGSVAAGAVPLPFLAVYAVMFIVHGGFHPVVPPDITSTQHGELVAGIVALVLLVIASVAVLWMLNGRRRWPFVIVQLATLGTAVDFIVDTTRGGRFISGVLVLTALLALVLAYVPQSWPYFRPERTPVGPSSPATGPAVPGPVEDVAVP
jgi:hypothetical protein